MCPHVKTKEGKKVRILWERVRESREKKTEEIENKENIGSGKQKEEKNRRRKKRKRERGGVREIEWTSGDVEGKKNKERYMSKKRKI